MARNGGGLSGDRFQRLVGELYATATDFSRWDGVIDLVTQYSGSVNAGFSQMNLRSRHYHSVTNIDPAMQAAYEAHYHFVNPLWPAVWAAPAGAVNTDEMVLQKQDFLRGEFFNDWVRHQGVYTSLTIAAEASPEGRTFFGIYAPREFSEAEVRTYRRLAPHVVSAVGLGRRISRLEGERQLDRSMLDRVATGVVVLDLAARVIFANARAQALFAPPSPFVVRHGRLQLTRPREAGLLAAAIGACTSRTFGTTLMVNRPPPQRPLRLTVTSGSLQAADPVFDRPVATILIEDLTPAPPDVEVVRQRHGLTQTEARIATAIASGLGIDATAAATGVSRNTVRAHLRSIYEQTGSHSQADLVRLVLS